VHCPPSSRLVPDLLTPFRFGGRFVPGNGKNGPGHNRLAPQAVHGTGLSGECRAVRGGFNPFEWAYLDSNQGPQLYQSCALAN
jgi:hypothetical protein